MKKFWLFLIPLIFLISCSGNDSVVKSVFVPPATCEWELLIGLAIGVPFEGTITVDGEMTNVSGTTPAGYNLGEAESVSAEITKLLDNYAILKLTLYTTDRTQEISEQSADPWCVVTVSDQCQK